MGRPVDCKMTLSRSCEDNWNEIDRCSHPQVLTEETRPCGRCCGVMKTSLKTPLQDIRVCVERHLDCEKLKCKEKREIEMIGGRKSKN
jgi:hypothetical protein